jgi:hypothetical protein
MGLGQNKAALAWIAGIGSTIITGLVIGDKVPWWWKQTKAGDGGITEQQAVETIEKYLNSKTALYGPPFERRLAYELLSGEKLIQLGWWQTYLKSRSSEFRYGSPKVIPISSSFSVNGNEATIEVVEEETVSFYSNGKPAPRPDDKQTKCMINCYSKRRTFYALTRVGEKWKISDSKWN